MKSQCIAQPNRSQQENSYSNTTQDQYFRLSSYLLENSKGDLYKVLQSITWYMFKLKAKCIARSAIARFAKCHIDTVSEINMRLEAAGIFQIERGYKKINAYQTSFLKVLAMVFDYAPKCWLSSTFLLDESYINKYSNKSIENKNQVFDNKLSSKKGEEVGKIVFSPITGFYCPLELRPFNNTIEVSYADNVESIGRSVNNLFPDFEKIAIYEAQLANANRLAKESLELAKELEPIYKKKYSQEQIDRFLKMLL